MCYYKKLLEFSKKRAKNNFNSETFSYYKGNQHDLFQMYTQPTIMIMLFAGKKNRYLQQAKSTQASTILQKAKKLPFKPRGFYQIRDQIKNFKLYNLAWTSKIVNQKKQNQRLNQVHNYLQNDIMDQLHKRQMANYFIVNKFHPIKTDSLNDLVSYENYMFYTQEQFVQQSNFGKVEDKSKFVHALQVIRNETYNMDLEDMDTVQSICSETDSLMTDSCFSSTIESFNSSCISMSASTA